MMVNLKIGENKVKVALFLHSLVSTLVWNEVCS